MVESRRQRRRQAGARARSLYKVKGRLTLTLKFAPFNAETHKLRYLISFATITESGDHRRRSRRFGGVAFRKSAVSVEEKKCSPFNRWLKMPCTMYRLKVNSANGCRLERFVDVWTFGKRFRDICCVLRQL